MADIALIIIGLSALVIASTIPYIVVLHGLDQPGTKFDDLPLPEDLALELTADQLAEYNAYWLSIKNKDENVEKVLESRLSRASGCKVNFSFKEPTPVYERDGELIKNHKTDSGVDFNANEQVTAVCGGSRNTLTHINAASLKPQSAVMTCQSDDYFTSDWLPTAVRLSHVTCSFHPPLIETKVRSCGIGGTLIEVGVLGTRPWNLFRSCFHEGRAEVLYTEHTLAPEHHSTGHAKRPQKFKQGIFFPGLEVNNLYKTKNHKKLFATILGSPELADKYVKRDKMFLTRGHLVPKSDFVFNYEQRATFTFLNTAPQWSLFNQGNWQKLEENLRMRIANGKLNAQIFTGTWGLMTLKDDFGVFKPIYLSPSDKKIPVPLWFYKIVRDTASNRATAFIGLNNPYVSASEAKDLAFCPDKCADNNAFEWLPWDNNNPILGYSFCCDVNDFRKVVRGLPPFTVSGLFS